MIFQAAILSPKAPSAKPGPYKNAWKRPAGVLWMRGAPLLKQELLAQVLPGLAAYFIDQTA
jgi:hypothetical protein